MNVLVILQARVAELKTRLSRTLAGDPSVDAYQDEVSFLEPIVKAMIEAQSKEIEKLVDLSDLDGRRMKIAEDRYANHDFERSVVACNGWEICANVYSRVVYLDNGDEDSIRQTFAVTFIPHTDIVVE